MNGNHATTHHCPAYPWNTPEREEFSTRAFDFQGLEKNRLLSSPVKPPPAGLLDTASEQSLARMFHANVNIGGRGEELVIYHHTQNVDFGFCWPKDTMLGDRLLLKLPFPITRNPGGENLNCLSKEPLGGAFKYGLVKRTACCLVKLTA